MVFHQRDTKKWIATTLSGTVAVEWPCECSNPSEPAWTADSRHWVECVKSLDANGENRVDTRGFGSTACHGPALRPSFASVHHFMRTSTRLCAWLEFTKPGDLLLQFVDKSEVIEDFGVKRLTVVRLASRDIDAGTSVAQGPLDTEPLVIRFPESQEKPMQPTAPVLSPNGDRMVLPRTVGRSWKANDGNEYQTRAFDIVLSDLAGKDVKVIGAMRWKHPPVSSPRLTGLILRCSRMVSRPTSGGPQTDGRSATPLTAFCTSFRSTRLIRATIICLRSHNKSCLDEPRSNGPGFGA